MIGSGRIDISYRQFSGLPSSVLIIYHCTRLLRHDYPAFLYGSAWIFGNEVAWNAYGLCKYLRPTMTQVVTTHEFTILNMLLISVRID